VSWTDTNTGLVRRHVRHLWCRRRNCVAHPSLEILLFKNLHNRQWLDIVQNNESKTTKNCWEC
jgi:hypothetical protein